MIEARSANLVTALSEGRASLTPKLAGIAGYALEEPERFIRSTGREICAVLNTSEPTLIKLCQHFGYAGLSDFRIDLALSLAGSGSGFVEPLADDRRLVNLAAKRGIARRAAMLIDGDRSLLIDSGSSAEAFVLALDEVPPLDIMTTGLRVAQHALDQGRHSVMLTGGRVRPNERSLTGPLVERSLQAFRFDTFVTSAASIDAEHGLSTFKEEEARTTRTLLEAARRTIVLADRTKIRTPALHRICALDRIDVLVTDLPADDPILAAIGAHGVEVICTAAPPPPDTVTHRDWSPACN